MSHFIQITAHFVCMRNTCAAAASAAAAAAAAFFNVSTLFATCWNQRSEQQQRPVLPVALWLLSRIALISQFIAIYKNMKNADAIQIVGRGKCNQEERRVLDWEAGAMQIKFKRVFSLTLFLSLFDQCAQFDLTKPMACRFPLPRAPCETSRQNCKILNNII